MYLQLVKWIQNSLLLEAASMPRLSLLAVAVSWTPIPCMDLLVTYLVVPEGMLDSSFWILLLVFLRELVHEFYNQLKYAARWCSIVLLVYKSYVTNIYIFLNIQFQFWRYTAENSVRVGASQDTDHPELRQPLAVDVWKSIVESIEPGSKITILTNGPLTNLAQIIGLQNSSSVIQVMLLTIFH